MVETPWEQQKSPPGTSRRAGQLENQTDCYWMPVWFKWVVVESEVGRSDTVRPRAFSMAREASLQVASAKPVVCRETSPLGEMAMMIRRIGSGSQFDGELDGAIGELGLGDRVALAARLQLGCLGGVGLEESREFLRFAPQALEVVMEDRAIGSDAEGESPAGQLHASAGGDLVEQADLAMGRGGEAQPQAGCGQGRLAFDLGFYGNGVRHGEAPSVRSEKEKAPGWLGPGLGKVTIRWVSGWSYDYDGFLGWIKVGSK